MTCYRFKGRWKETMCDLISHSGVLISPDMHWETDSSFDCRESDQQDYSLWEIRVFLPIFIRLQRLHTEINAECEFVRVCVGGGGLHIKSIIKHKANYSSSWIACWHVACRCRSFEEWIFVLWRSVRLQPLFPSVDVILQKGQIED